MPNGGGTGTEIPPPVAKNSGPTTIDFLLHPERDLTGLVMRGFTLSALVLSLIGLPLHAQDSESAGFIVTRGADTVALEHFSRSAYQLEGELILPPMARQRSHYRATVLDDATTPLVELQVWRGDDPEQSSPRQRTRIIFKEDSVAIDDISSGGLLTVILPTAKSAIPYLNLSFAFLEQGVMRARVLGGDSASVPFFSLGGGQTLSGTVRTVGADSAAVEIGGVDFRLKVDGRGRILGGSIPAQRVLVTRAPR